MAKNLRVGDRAPDFVAESQLGERVSLAEKWASSTVVLYFYPWDYAPTCVEQAQGFRDRQAEFYEANAIVIGVSGDQTARHCSFAAKHRLSQILISDGDGSIRRSYGVPRRLGILPGRVTYVIGRGGVIEDVFIAQFQAREHVARALRVAQSLVPEDITLRSGDNVA
jgi:peroxiredoxin Q/BCP